MNERDFLDAISRSTDDLPRLAFADWLEERNDPRAPWVRNKKLWKFMAPNAADPITRMAQSAAWNDEWASISELAEELGTPAFFSFMSEYAENRRRRAPEWLNRPHPGFPPSETVQRIVEAFEPWRAKHRRPAWLPVLDDDEGPLTASKFCGTPWIGEGAPWPDCKHCLQPLLLFVQLNLAELPEEFGDRNGPGLLQLFHCPRDECRHWGCGEHFADHIVCVRVVHPQGPGQTIRVPELERRFPAVGIGAWSRFSDLPNWQECEALGIQYKYDSNVTKLELECQEFSLAFDNIDANEDVMGAIASSERSDKLGGWPTWVQNVNYPKCPRCGRRMVYVFQLTSEDNVPYMFGDCGTGQITQCPEHKDVVAFGWDCC